MRIALAMPYAAPATADREPADLVEEYPLLARLPRELAARGHAVEVVISHPRAGELAADGVRWRLVPPPRASRALAAVAAAALPTPRAELEVAPGVARRVWAARPDVVHFLGATLHLNLALLLARRPPGGAPVVVHFHGGEPARGRVARLLQRRNLARVARLLVTAGEQAAPFVAAGLLPAHGERVSEVVETSSPLAPVPREEARRRTGLSGDPLCVWAARLAPVKDPLTALDGFAALARRRPGARLVMHWLDGELEGEVRERIAAAPELRRSVELRGRVPRSEMAAVLSAADFLLQASRREHSGCAVLDAMACGAVPAVTDIPSMRALTGQGEAGLLFPVGDAAALAEALAAVGPERLAELRRRVRARFRDRLSFAAMARRLEGIYREVAGGR